MKGYGTTVTINLRSEVSARPAVDNFQVLQLDNYYLVKTSIINRLGSNAPRPTAHSIINFIVDCPRCRFGHNIHLEMDTVIRGTPP